MATPYRPAAACRRLMGARAWYWGDDHLLLAERHGFVVRYRRFFFADLQTFFVWPTRALPWRIAVEIACFALFIWLAAALRVPYGPAALTTILAVIVASEAALGPTAEGELRTIHGVERGPLAGRLRAGRRVLAEVRRRAEAAQGGSVATAAPLDLRRLETAASATVAAPTGSRRRYARGRFSWSLWLLIAALFASGLDEMIGAGNATPVPVYRALLSFALIVGMLAALLDVSLLHVLPALRAYAWTVLALEIGTTCAAVFGGMIWAVASAARGEPQWMLQATIAHDQRWLMLASGVLELGLGLAGLVLSHDGHYLPRPETAP